MQGGEVVQFDPDLLKGLVNDPDNEKFAFGEKHNSWQEVPQYQQANPLPEEKQFVDETKYVRPQIYNAEFAKNAKTNAKVVAGVLALAAAGTITAATTIFHPTSDYMAEITYLSATENAIYYQVESENWDESANLSVVIYNGNKQIYRVDKMDFSEDSGEQTNLPTGVYFTIEIKDGNVTLAKEKIKTVTHVAKDMGDDYGKN